MSNDELMAKEFPLEVFIPVEGEEFLCGRLTVNELKGEYAVEVDVVQKSSGKIYRHIGIYSGKDEAKEAIEDGRVAFFDYLERSLTS